MALSINSFVKLYEALNLSWRASNTVPLGGASLVLPAYAAPRVLSEARPSGVTITEATLAAATRFLDQGRRVDAYLLLANATQNQQFLLTAQISSGSGVWVGGPAINVNAALQLAYPSVYPTFSIAEFSDTILRTEIDEIRKRPTGTPNTYFAPSELEVLEDAREEGWLKAKGVEDSNLRAIFPGNLLLLYHYAKTGNQLKYDEIIAADGESRVRDLLVKTGLAAWSEATDHGPQFGLTRAQAQARAAQGGSVETQTVIGQTVTIYKDAAGAAFALFRPQDDLISDTQPGLGLSNAAYSAANDPFKTGGSTAGYLLASAANFLGNSATDPEKVALNNFINATKTTNATNPQFNQSVVETVAALHRLLVNPQATPPAAGDAAEALVRLNAILKKDDLVASQALVAIVGKGNDALATAAKADSAAGKAYRYALQNLHLVALTNADYSKLGADIDSSLALQSDATPNGMTKQYIADRSNLMYWNIQRNLANNPSALSAGPGVQGMHFKDVKSSLEFDLGLPDNVVEKRQTLFGGDGADPLLGKKLDDRLYGGAGNDTLDGKGGNDYLEGGTGTDTYQFDASHWGQDTVVDADGLGSIKLGNITLSECKRWGNSNNVWLDSTDTYLIVKVRAVGASDTAPVTPQTAYNLIIARKDQPAAATITVRGWTQDRSLGINLGQTATPAIAANADSDIFVYRSIDKVPEGTGNFSARPNPAAPGQGMRDYQATGTQLTGTSDFTSTAAGAQFVRGDLHTHSIKLGDGNNLVTTSEYSVSSRENDTVLQAGGRQYIPSGGDTIVTGSGSDIIFAGGGSNFIDTGDGDDFIAAGGLLLGLGSSNLLTPGLLPMYANDTVTADNIASQSRISSYRPGLGPWGTYTEADAGNRQGAGLQIYGAAFGQDFGSWSGQAGTASAEVNTPNVVYAGAGNDKVIGSASDDLIVLGQGNDFALGYMGKDEIYGDSGDDWILGDGIYLTDAQWATKTTAGQELRRADSGDDSLYGGDGNDVLLGQGGNDMLEGGSGNDDLYGDDANYLSAYNNGQYVERFGTAGQDAGEDYLDGGDGNDRLIGGGKDDGLYGGNGDDTLWGDNSRPDQLALADHGSDYLDGEAGNDVLYGGDKDDTLVGGTGDDQLYGQEGNDTYILSLGDGTGPRGDTLTDTEGNNTLVIKGVSLAGIGLKLGSSGQLMVGYGDLTESSDANGNNTVTASNWVTLTGGVTSPGISTLQVDDQSISFAEFVGKNLKEKVTANTTAAGQQLTGGAVADALSALDDGAVVSGGQGNDAIVLGSSRAGSTVLLRRGDGIDSISSSEGAGAGLGGGNTLAFGTGISSSALQVTRGAGGGVVLTSDSQTGAIIDGGIANVSFADNGMVVTLAQLVQDSLDAQRTAGNDMIEGSMLNDTISGGLGDDVLIGNEGDDTLIADGGNDVLIGGIGNDTYVIDASPGKITLRAGLSEGQVSANVGADRIVLPGSSSQNSWTASRTDNSLVLIAQLPGNVAATSVRLDGYFDSSVNAGVWASATVEFADGSTAAVAELLRQTSFATEGDNFIYGTAYQNVIDALGGDDTVYVLQGNDVVYGGSGNDFIDGGAGNDLLNGGNGNDRLLGGVGNDVILGGDGDDVLTGGGGSDAMSGGAGNDTYIFDAVFPALVSVTHQYDGGTERFIRVPEGDVVNDTSGADVIRIDGVMGNAATALRATVKVFIDSNDSLTVVWGTGGLKVAGGSDALTRMKLEIDGVQAALVDYLKLPPVASAGATLAEKNASFIAGKELLARGQIEYAGIAGALAWRDSPDDALGALMKPLAQDDSQIDVSRASFRVETKSAYYTYTGYRNAAGEYFDSQIKYTTQKNYVRVFNAQYDTTITVPTSDPDRPETWYMKYVNTTTVSTFIFGLTPVTEQRVLFTGTDYVFLPAAASVDAQLGAAANSFTFSAGLVHGGDGDDTIVANLASFSRDENKYAVREDDYYNFSYSFGAHQTIALTSRNNILLTGQTTATWIDGGAGNDTILGSEVADVMVGSSGFNSLDGRAGPDRYLVLDSGIANTGYDYIADTGSSVPLKPELSEIYGGLAQEVLPPGSDIDTVEFGPGIQLSDLHFSLKTNIPSFVGYYGGWLKTFIPDDMDVDTITFGMGIQYDSAGFTPTVGSGDASPYLLVERDGRRLAAIEIATSNQSIAGAGVEYLQFQDGQKITMQDAIRFAVAKPLNHAPTALALPDQQAIETQSFSYKLPVNTFTDVDLGNSLTSRAKLTGGAALPAWLIFNAATQTLSGTPPETASGLLSVTITGTDEQGATASSSFSLDIANIINGTALDDVLTGTVANDVIYGGLGVDRMAGGKGNDVYYVDNALDKVVEKANEGRETVHSTVSYTLAANVDDLVLDGAAAIDGTGNVLDNRIEGNTADNKLMGGDGNDTLLGGAGDDWLRGGAGGDTLAGGTGDDLYEVDNTGDVVVENFNEGVDTVESSVTYSLSQNVENLILTGTLAVDGTGNALDNNLQGNDAANVLMGGAGNDTLNGKKGLDTLTGGAGNDTYLLEDDVDTIVELAGEGLDAVLSRYALALAANIEDGMLLGSAVNITGNGLANVLTGNNAANTIDGGAGADVMLGGKGNDTYVVDGQADTVIEKAGEGTDTVQSSVNYTLADNLENLTLTGIAEAGMGNSLNNKITGNAASNKLFGGDGNDDMDGGAGADILFGGLGNDKYWVDSSSSLVVEAAGEGTDTVYANVSYALADNAENLILTGSANTNAVGNAGNNRLNGNAGNNILFGGLGNDTYVFGRGSGRDIVANFDAGKPSGDKVQLGAGIVDADLNCVREGNDLVLSIKGTTDQLTVAGYFENGGKGAHALEKIRFADGMSLNHAAVLSRSTVGTGDSAMSDAQSLPAGVRIGNPIALFDTPALAATKTSDASITPQSVAESINAARQRFEQTLKNLKLGTDEQGSLSRSEFAERRALPLLWNLQDALLSLQLAKNAGGRFTADVSIDSRATRDLGLGISLLGAINSSNGRLDQIAKPDDVQQFNLVQLH